MRVITLIVVHCSAVKPDHSWHRKDRHYKFGIGYHYVIRRNGEIEPGRPEWMVGAHCLVKGHHYNTHSIGICYEGGYDARGQPDDTRTAEQKATMRHAISVTTVIVPASMRTKNTLTFSRSNLIAPVEPMLNGGDA